MKYQWERVSSKREGWLGNQTTKRMRQEAIIPTRLSD